MATKQIKLTLEDVAQDGSFTVREIVEMEVPESVWQVWQAAQLIPGPLTDKA